MGSEGVPPLVLPGTLSDDPAFPKAAWPGPALCAACHEEQNGVHVWNRDQVLLFLGRHYGASNLSHRYALSPPDRPASGPAQVQPPQEEQQERNQEQQPGSGPGRLVQKQEAAGPGGGLWVLGLGFTSTDMSLCVLLYVCSCLVLMLLFFFFKVKSKRWKRRQSHLLV